MTLAKLCEEYAPYHTFPEFKEGFVDYQLRQTTANYSEDVKAQAYDRGQECAMRWARLRFRGQAQE